MCAGNRCVCTEVCERMWSDGMSIDFGTFEQGFPLGQVRMQEAYLEAKGIYEIEYPNIGCSGYDDILCGGKQGIL